MHYKTAMKDDSQELEQGLEEVLELAAAQALVMEQGVG